jgi:hypothetical protein
VLQVCPYCKWQWFLFTPSLSLNSTPCCVYSTPCYVHGISCCVCRASHAMCVQHPMCVYSISCCVYIPSLSQSLTDAHQVHSLCWLLWTETQYDWWEMGVGSFGLTFETPLQCDHPSLSARDVAQQHKCPEHIDACVCDLPFTWVHFSHVATASLSHVAPSDDREFCQW